MLFIVDGYNVTKGDPASRSLSLEGQRDALVGRLRVRGQQLLGRGRIVVVFDGDAGMAQAASARGSSHPVEVVYSRGVSADDTIVALAVTEAASGVCIVTSDRGLVDRASEQIRSRVDVRPRETVYEAAAGRPRRAGRGGVARDVGIPRGGNKITEELKDIWLDDED